MKSDNEPRVGQVWSYVGYGKDIHGELANDAIRLLEKTEGGFVFAILRGNLLRGNPKIGKCIDERQLRFFWQLELGPEIKGREK